MSDKPFFDERGEPAQDPVDDFMRQLSTNAAKQRRTKSPGAGVAKTLIARNALDNSDGAKAVQKPEAKRGPVIETVTVAERGDGPGCWAVEASDSEGSIFQADFKGPDAEGRAREYARWKYGGES